MATYDGSGDIGFTPEEMREILFLITESIAKSKPGDLLTISMGISKASVVVNVREPRHRGPIENLGVKVLPYGRSIL